MAALRPVWRWRPSLSSPNAALCLHKMALAGSGTSPAGPAGGGRPADRPATSPPAAPGSDPPAAEPPATDPCPSDGPDAPKDSSSRAYPRSSRADSQGHNP
ncbi:hypothetical protein ACP4OV_030798 [Aristida adscensionis]